MRFASIQTIPGFRDIAELYAKGETAWYRARGESDSSSISGSVLLRVGASDEARASVRREMDFHAAHDPRDFTGPAKACIRARQLLEHEDLNVLVCDDSGGRPIGAVLESRKFDLNSFLITAAELSLILEELHGAGIAHGGPLAENVFLDAEEFAVFPAGLGAAPERARKPEIDLRNLGRLFYAMIHGAGPGEDPEPLHRLHPGFPLVVSEIILKLLGVAAPYQSAAGLHPDLRSCAQQLEVFKTIEDFEPGRMDRPLSHA